MGLACATGVPSFGWAWDVRLCGVVCAWGGCVRLWGLCASVGVVCACGDVRLCGLCVCVCGCV